MQSEFLANLALQHSNRPTVGVHFHKPAPIRARRRRATILQRIARMLAL